MGEMRLVSCASLRLRDPTVVDIMYAEFDALRQKLEALKKEEEG
jgi:hypothetical protein